MQPALRYDQGPGCCPAPELVPEGPHVKLPYRSFQAAVSESFREKFNAHAAGVNVYAPTERSLGGGHLAPKERSRCGGGHGSESLKVATSFDVGKSKGLSKP